MRSSKPRTTGSSLPTGSSHGCGSPVKDGDTRAEYKQVTVLFDDVVHSMEIAAAVGTERLREVMADLADRCARKRLASMDTWRGPRRCHDATSREACPACPKTDRL